MTFDLAHPSSTALSSLATYLGRLDCRNSNVPPKVDGRIVKEIEVEDGSSVDYIRVENPKDYGLVIPGGWIISADSWQVRAINYLEYIEPHWKVVVSASCLEKSRWNPKSKTVAGVRALFSVIAGICSSPMSSSEAIYLFFITPKIKLTINPSITSISIPSAFRVIMMVLERKLAVPTIAASSGSLWFMLLI